MSKKTVSLIIPCYNEEVNIQKGVLDKVANFTRSKDNFQEVIIVDDGSTDDSISLIEKYTKKYSKFKLVKNRHQGKAIAVITGIQEAQGDYVIFTDMDLATPLEETNKLVEQFNAGEKVVIGSRSGRREGAPLSRQIQARGFMIIRDLIIGLQGITDTQCGFKGFERKTANTIIDKLQIFTKNREVQGASVSAAFDLEFLFVARKLGYNIVEIPVRWHHAETKNVSLWKDSIETIRDLLRIRMNALQGKYSQ